jgi:hypothetical protein
MADQITYRLALDSDINRINDFYNKIYKKNRTYDQFYWEFNTAPAGKAIYVIAEQNGEVVGTQCAIPYFVIDKNNQEILSAKSEDTLVSPAHRGKNIFENMYKLLIEECKKSSIVFIWGFTYADKPFRKLGFEIPYKSTIGLLTISPFKTADYFYSVTAKKGFVRYLKILGLSFTSFLKFSVLKLKSNAHTKPLTQSIKTNNNIVGYLRQNALFGLKLDGAFLDYRINKNPYSSNYQTINLYDNEKLMASIYYNVTKENVGYIIHLYLDPSLDEDQSSEFIRKGIFETNLKRCDVIRYWGFTHNSQNQDEVRLLKNTGFTFLNIGISFVGLNLKDDRQVKFSDFVLSRMASQGTD